MGDIIKYDCVVFDWDGTLAYSDKMIISSLDLISKYSIESKYILTNSSSRTPVQIRDILRDNNVEFDLKNIITGNELVFYYMHIYNLNRPYFVGKKPHYHNEEDWDLLVLTYSDKITFDEIKNIKESLYKAKKIVALDNSVNVPREGYFSPGSYWLVKTLENILDIEIELIGKPSLFPKQMLEKRGCTGRVLFIGDSASDRDFAEVCGYDYLDIKEWEVEKE